MTERGTKQVGDLGEKYAAAYLKKKGYKILKRNYRRPEGEIDIIALKDGTLAFVEVKTRNENSLVPPQAAVNYEKQKKIIRTASRFFSENSLELNFRFDICEVFVDINNYKLLKINYFENAFSVRRGSGHLF